MQHHTVIQSCTDERVAPAITPGDVLRPPEQQVKWELGSADCTNFQNLGQGCAFEGHHHQYIGIRVRARCSLCHRAEQNHPLRGERLNKAVGERLEGCLCNERRRGHGPIIAGVALAGYTVLRRQLRWLVAALSAPEPPVAEALGERELRSWRMLLVQLFGTGPRWRPLAEAWAVLWQAGAWRQELIQLLLLLAERCERRLHPLPWALAAGAADSGGLAAGHGAGGLASETTPTAHDRPRAPMRLAELQQLAPQLRELLARHGASNPAVFGSVARDQASASSDVDLLVDLPAGASLFDRAELKSDLEALLLTRVDLIRRRNLKPILKATVEAEAIPL